jgi:hypothetical protein
MQPLRSHCCSRSLTFRNLIIGIDLIHAFCIGARGRNLNVLAFHIALSSPGVEREQLIRRFAQGPMWSPISPRRSSDYGDHTLNSS